MSSENNQTSSHNSFEENDEMIENEQNNQNNQLQQNQQNETIQPPHEKKEKYKKDEAKYTMKKREMKNLESYQQSVLLGLINHFCSFTIENPGKHSKVTVTTPRLVSITLNDEVIEVNKLALNQSLQIMENELSSGLNQSTANRRYEKNTKILIENFLFDTCLEQGFLFESKPSRKSQKSQQLERIYNVYFNMKHIMDQNLLLKIGNDLNEFFFSSLEKEKRITFERNDDQIISILKSNGIDLRRLMN